MTRSRTTSAARRLMLVHAHPDDETLITGGTIAAACDAGIEVLVVTCTLGEEGEIIGDELAGLAAQHADQLGGYRYWELQRALSALEAPESRGRVRGVFLGGAGRWRDSGMAGTDGSRNPRAFINAPLVDTASALAALIQDFQPHVVTTYDPNGTYGHPDHIRVHEVTHRAVELAAASARGWDVPRLYWSVIGHQAFQENAARLSGVPADWVREPGGGLGLFPDEQITTRIDVRDQRDRKAAALQCHATQIMVDLPNRAFALSNWVAQPIMDEEHFVLVRTTGHPVPDGQAAHGLFAGPGPT
ncbi:N-acetyl-1-D-myo-inositol-2-amino-2-deoxy-alpha-D-glucopyranoside deacetylase [Hoyosella sp. G463]|uniref:1D-myo-inositol 2-acetamido-2-deoxy-alpha-D-glucopyranoside deacetylase n=1 Tax=Lolliginicoccus lacisalsi TaxID=2742202 RepID=A0A927PL05_9ACTN|nr:N-acetyl-1-D-myo-inositol-2-amino-2-deoxy-alpha-D-glucopyranoside deacetylase [Lolliginicoccus lacisalsi]MBD8506268.1 N-acetyl-1-D-myo-inositol-2-amino-2-deoxy-alpha-D-glucopyranoside deacetylase [Lolliginicoccus lacisalsi]